MNVLDFLRVAMRPGAHDDPDPAQRERAEDMLDAYAREFTSDVRPFGGAPLKPARCPGGQAILAAEPAAQVAVLRAALDRALPQLAELRRSREWAWPEDVVAVCALAGQLARRQLPYAEADMQWIIGRLADCAIGWEWFDFSGIGLAPLLKGFQRATGDRPLPEETRRALARLRAQLDDAQRTAPGRDVLARIEALLGAAPPTLFEPADDWGQAAVAALAALPPAEREPWLEVLCFAATARGSKPSGKWLAAARERVADVGEERFGSLASDWLRLLDRPSRDELYEQGGTLYPTAFIADRNADVLKGLAWCCAGVDDAALTHAVGDAALASFKKIPMIGARSTKVGNACVWALGAMPGFAAVAELQRLRERVKLPSANKQIDAAFAQAAASRALSRDDLDDLAAPAFGLVDGRARTALGCVTAEIVVAGAAAPELRFLRADGRAASSAPAEVRNDHAAELAELRRTLKDLRSALGAQRARIERQMLLDREWSAADWRARYLDHPLVSTFARRLIWTFERDGRRTAGAWLDGRIVGADDHALDWLDAETRVRPWRPIEADAAEVLAWRDWLDRHGVSQPFKQAHREIYLLTDAERATETYSNRFAAHLLRQHQFHALCRERGWRYSLQGAWDSHNTPTLDLPHVGLRAEFWVEGVEGPAGGLSGHAIYVYVSTGQVRFTRRGGGPPVELADVPPRVFTEVLRDVDLFVGVCSVGNDPNWLDRGDTHGAYADYWWNFSFGELSASATTRREALSRLLPRIRALEGRWELAERFLSVRGDLRTYKIHLGSGNVLMSPDDQCLCVVQGPGGDAGGLLLPFEGDAQLSIILSKALLLANDRSIKDPSITRQLHAR